ASDFLQIPPHDGHPCHSLTVPTAKPVVDFHHQVVAHAGRTKRRLLQNAISLPYFQLNYKIIIPISFFSYLLI
ncbi:hypothetical protein, partial [Marinilactibacillus psychrotolerans]|uniref:hypothetical protein n=1 Tax=Marinilactibacillus psychrotolerans TaxID=191770 RepID=UPI00388A1005